MTASTRTFTIDELDDFVANNARLIESVNRGRWSEHLEYVFAADDGKFYVVDVEEGLTEYQDYYGEDRYPDCKKLFDDWVVECAEVEIYEEMVPQRKWRVKA